MEETMDQEHELILTDGETGAQFTLKVNSEDYIRAMTDMTFAQQLLISASSSAVSSPSTASSPHSSEVACDEEETDEPHEQQTSQKHEWQYEEVKCLLNSYEQHKDELSHPKKRKFAWDNIANNIISNGYSVNATICKNKWKNLLRTYKTAKDSKKRTGNAPSRFNFFNDIDDIIGNKPSNSCTHTIESSVVTAVLEGPSTSTVEEDKQTNDEHEDPKKNQVEKKGSDKKNKDKRHEERMQVARERLEVEKKKVELLQQYLNLKNNNIQ